MSIIIHTKSLNGNVCDIQVPSLDITVKEFNELIKQSIPTHEPELSKILYAGKILDPTATLRESRLNHDHNVVIFTKPLKSVFARVGTSDPSTLLPCGDAP